MSENETSQKNMTANLYFFSRRNDMVNFYPINLYPRSQSRSAWVECSSLFACLSGA